MALAWNWTRRGLVAGALLVPIACVAHTLPVMWAVAIMTYAWLWRRMPVRQRAYLMGGALAAVLAGGVAIRNSFPTLWFREQLTNILGVDQARVFGGWYQPVMFGLVLLCAALFFKLFRQAGLAKTFWTLPVQHLADDAARDSGGAEPDLDSRLPERADVHRQPYVAGSRSVSVRGAGDDSGAPVRALRTGSGGTAVLCISLPRRASLNGIEDRMEALVRKLPPNSRVVSAIEDPYLRVNAITHMIDRICVGHCYSYANYEPSTDPVSDPRDGSQSDRRGDLRRFLPVADRRVCGEGARRATVPGAAQRCGRHGDPRTSAGDDDYDDETSTRCRGPRRPAPG